MFAMAFATCNSRLGVQKMMTRLTSFFVDEFDPKLWGSKGHPDEQAGSFLDLADGRMFQSFSDCFMSFGWSDFTWFLSHDVLRFHGLVWSLMATLSKGWVWNRGVHIGVDSGGLRFAHVLSPLALQHRCFNGGAWWNPTSTGLSVWGITPQRASQVGRRRREWISLNWKFSCIYIYILYIYNYIYIYIFIIIQIKYIRYIYDIYIMINVCMYILCMYIILYGIDWDSFVLPGDKEYTMGSALLASESWSFCLLWWQRNHHTLQVRSPRVRLEAVLLVVLGEASFNVRKDCESTWIYTLKVATFGNHRTASVQRADVPSSLAILRYSYPEERSIKDKEGIEWWPQHVKDASTCVYIIYILNTV